MDSASSFMSRHIADASPENRGFTIDMQKEVPQGDASAVVQSSTEIPGTRLNSSVFAVTTIRPLDRACPAII